MRTVIVGAVPRRLLAGVLLACTAQCGAASVSASAQGVASAEAVVSPTPMFHAKTAATGHSSSAVGAGVAFDSSRYVPGSYGGEPAGTSPYGVFTAATAGVTEWFDTPAGSHGMPAYDSAAIAAFGIEYSSSLGTSRSDDSLIVVSRPTPAASDGVTATTGSAPLGLAHVYDVSFQSDALTPTVYTTIGGPLPLGTQAWPSVVAVSDGNARLVIAGEGQCCPGGGSCGGAGEPAFQNYVYSFTKDAPTARAARRSGIDSWEYVLDSSGQFPACAIGVTLDNAKSSDNLPGEVAFVLYDDGSVQPWLTNTSVWGERTSWKVPGAISLVAYDEHVAILDGQGNVFYADPYRSSAPELVYATGAQEECGGEAQALTFDVTDPAPTDSDPAAKGGSLILQMQDATDGNAPVVCWLPSTGL